MLGENLKKKETEEIKWYMPELIKAQLFHDKIKFLEFGRVQKRKQK